MIRCRKVILYFNAENQIKFWEPEAKRIRGVYTRAAEPLNPWYCELAHATSGVSGRG